MVTDEKLKSISKGTDCIAIDLIEFVAMARELLALRRVAEAVKECEPYYRDPAEGYPYGPEALKLIKAIENWRKLRGE